MTISLCLLGLSNIIVSDHIILHWFVVTTLCGFILAALCGFVVTTLFEC